MKKQVHGGMMHRVYAWPFPYSGTSFSRSIQLLTWLLGLKENKRSHSVSVSVSSLNSPAYSIFQSMAPSPTKHGPGHAMVRLRQPSNSSFNSLLHCVMASGLNLTLDFCLFAALVYVPACCYSHTCRDERWSSLRVVVFLEYFPIIFFLGFSWFQNKW